MRVKATVFQLDDKGIAPGAMKEAARNIPVTVGFDSSRVVGRATVFPDGSAELEIDAPMERTSGGGMADGVMGLGFVVEQESQEGGQRVIEKLRPISVGISAELLDKARRRL